jgi:hypothetical protein
LTGATIATGSEYTRSQRKDDCVADVFVRLSTSDNNHKGQSAVGVKTKASDKVLAEADRALLRLFLGTPSRVDIIGKNSTAAERDQEAAQYVTGIGASTKLSDKWSGQQLTSRKTQVTSDASGAFKGVLVTRYVDIGSIEEQLEMLAVQESSKVASLRLSMKHKIYRTLDPRRYSMYFNRWYDAINVLSLPPFHKATPCNLYYIIFAPIRICRVLESACSFRRPIAAHDPTKQILPPPPYIRSAYTMVLEREKLVGFQYDWVFHGRLDAAWGAPVKPHYLWSNVSAKKIMDHSLLMLLVMTFWCV